MRKGQTMPGSKLETLGSLKRFNDALAGRAAETPQLEGTRAIFGGMVSRVHGFAQQQAELTANKQDITQQFQEELVEAQRLATAIRAALKSHYGPDSERLVEFGIQPFRGKNRKRKEPPPPPIEAPAEE
jgi:hypothetical protein